jgi:transposase InsO family protein
VQTVDGWVYTTVIDLYSRKVVGYAVADHLRTSLIIEALAAAPRRTSARRDGRRHISWMAGTPRRPQRALHLRAPSSGDRRIRSLDVITANV